MTSSGEASAWEPKHELSEPECAALQAGLANEVKERGGENAITAVWIGSQSPYADLVRTLEAKKFFPEIPDLMVGYEPFSKFLGVVDTRDGADQLVHAFRITSKKFGTDSGYISPGGTGIALIDDLLSSGQGLSEEQFSDFYSSREVDLDACVGVETNFRIAKTKTEGPLRVPELGYLTLFNLMERRLLESPAVAIFTHINRVAALSLTAAGVEFEPIAGQENLKTPTTGNEFDDRYRPVAIPSSPHNLQNFESLRPFGIAELEL